MAERTGQNRNRRAVIAAFFTVVFWSSAFTATKYVVEFLSPEALMLFRFLTASLVFLVVAAVKRSGLPKLRDLPKIMISAFVGLFMYMWLFNTGSKLGTPGIAGFVIASAPVFTMLISVLFMKEKPGLSGWTGVLISFAGLIIVAVGKGITRLDGDSGFLMLIGAAVATSIYNIMQRDILKRYDSLRATMYSVWSGTLFMLVFTPQLAAELPALPANAVLPVSATVVYLGVFPAALAYLLWNYALAGADKTVHATNFLYLSPFLTLLTAFLLLGETVPVLSVVGGGVIIIGMVFPNLITKLKGAKTRG